jgi:beta-glucosidase-like glycosyl hydrolase/CubicO group peptidase (beta-lactamase class C family)
MIFLFLLFSFLTMDAQVMPRLFASVDEQAMNRWVDSVFNRMSEEERIGQLFMVIAEPVAETKNITRLLRLVNRQKIGGILFLKGKPDAQAIVTNRLQQEAQIPLLIAIDGEWGLSMRLSHTTRFPKNMMLGAVADLKLLEEYGEEVGRQCREMGIHVNFAPDVDVNSNPDNPVIGLRSFGEAPDDVANRAIAYARGLEKAGVISVAKHFPGHGDTDADSHRLLPVIHHDRQRLDDVELLPFRRYIQSGLSGIMVAHLDIPALGTNGRPSSLSREVTTELLRDRMGFSGLCFTDGLAMKGAVAGGSARSVAVEALRAGNDVLVGPADPEKEIEAVRQAVGKKLLGMSELDRRCRRILCYKYIAGLNRVRPVPVKSLHERLNTPHAAWLNARLNAAAITIVKNGEDLLPLKQLHRKRIAALSLGGGIDNAFHRRLKCYGEVDCYHLPGNAAGESAGVMDKLKAYDVIICSVYPVARNERPELRQLAAERNMVFVFFTPPYHSVRFRNAVGKAQAVVMAYEPTPLAGDYAAQAIFGGISACGSLPVGVPGLFPLGAGVITEKIRLGFQEPGEAGVNPDRLRLIDTIVQEGLDREAYPGCQALVAKDGMIIYSKSFGYMDYSREQAVTERTVYDLASVSKAAGTLLAVMKLYDEGRYLLSDRISKFVTGLHDSDKKDLRIRDLLYHQSGLPPTIPFYEQAIDKAGLSGSLYSLRKDASHPLRFDARTYVNPDFKYNPALVSREKQKGFGTEVAQNFYVSDAFVSDSILSGIKNARLGAPGRYVYSCINFILLKMMIEQQTGEPMDQMLRACFFDRLGASSTTYRPLRTIELSRIPPTENDRFVRRQVIRGYVHDEAAAFQGGVSGNAGLFSSAVDLAKIMQLYLNDGTYGGERYLSEKTCKLFTGSKSPASRRGLGFDRPDAKNPSRSPCGLLAPQSVYGHTGYTGTCFWIDPESRMFFIFLSNRTYPSRANTQLFSLDIRTRIQDAIYKALE